MENLTYRRPQRPLLGSARWGVYDTLQQRKALGGAGNDHQPRRRHHELRHRAVPLHRQGFQQGGLFRADEPRGRSAALLPRKRLERGAHRLLRSPQRTGPPAHDMESRPGLSGGHTHRKRVLPGAQGLLFGKHAHAGRTPRRAARLERRAGLFPRRLHPARIPPRLHVRTGTAPPAGHMQRQYGHHDDHVHDRKSGQYTGADPRQRLLPLRIQRRQAHARHLVAVRPFAHEPAGRTLPDALLSGARTGGVRKAGGRLRPVRIPRQHDGQGVVRSAQTRRLRHLQSGQLPRAQTYDPSALQAHGSDLGLHSRRLALLLADRRLQGG